MPIRYNNLRRRFAPAMFAAMAQVVEHILGKDEVTSSNLVSSSKKKHFLLGSVSFCVCVRKTQHRLAACGQHHFEQSENIVINKRTQNEVAFGKQCCASHKRCGLMPDDVTPCGVNDVALCANL